MTSPPTERAVAQLVKAVEKLRTIWVNDGRTWQSNPTWERDMNRAVTEVANALAAVVQTEVVPQDIIVKREKRKWNREYHKLAVRLDTVESHLASVPRGAGGKP